MDQDVSPNQKKKKIISNNEEIEPWETEMHMS